MKPVALKLVDTMKDMKAALKRMPAVEKTHTLKEIETALAALDLEDPETVATIEVAEMDVFLNGGGTA